MTRGKKLIKNTEELKNYIEEAIELYMHSKKKTEVVIVSKEYMKIRKI